MRRLAVAILVLAACGKEAPPPAPAKPEPTLEAKLRDDVRRRVEALVPGFRLTPQDDLTLTGKRGDSDQQINLDNLWKEIQGATPDEREEMIAAFVRAVAAPPAPALTADRETKLKAIVPLVRGEDYVAEMRKMGPPATRPLVADLHVVYAFDGDENVTVIPADELAPLALSQEELDRRAVENLNALVGGAVELHTVGPMFMVTCGGTYESSLLLVDKLWEKLAGKVKGELVAACPARDLLLFTDGKSPEGLAALRKAVEEAFADGTRTISRKLIRRTAAGWAPYEE